MKIEVKYFAFFRQQIGRTSDEINLPNPATVADLLNSLRTIYPGVKDALNTAQISVNMEFVSLDTPLSARDEVALIPPVSGGNVNSNELGLFKITDTTITVQDVTKPIRGNDVGAVVTFLGTVRDNTMGRATAYLEYEAYAPMAEKKMAEIANEVRDKWGIKRMAMIHRVGRLEIGQVSVAVGVASPHRKDGFEACQYAMDRLKQIVPIWKREVWCDGEEEWVKPDPVYFQNSPNR